MKTIQVILILSLSMSAWLYLTRFRTIFRDRLAALVLLAAGILFILFPDSTTRIANMVGVVRGADLVIYVFMVTFIYLMILLYTKILHLELQQTEIIRSLALFQAKSPADHEETNAKSGSSE